MFLYHVKTSASETSGCSRLLFSRTPSEFMTRYVAMGGRAEGRRKSIDVLSGLPTAPGKRDLPDWCQALSHLCCSSDHTNCSDSMLTAEFEFHRWAFVDVRAHRSAVNIPGQPLVIRCEDSLIMATLPSLFASGQGTTEKLRSTMENSIAYAQPCLDHCIEISKYSRRIASVAAMTMEPRLSVRVSCVM